MATAVNSAKNPITFSSLQGNVGKFHQIVTNPKTTLNAKQVPEFVRQLEVQIRDFTGDKSNFLPLLYKFNLARRHVAKFLPKNTSPIFLPDYRQRPKELAGIMKTLSKAHARSTDPCGKNLVAAIKNQAEEILKRKGIQISPTPENMQLFFSYQRAFGGWPTPMQFVVHHALVDLEKAVQSKDLLNFIHKYNDHLNRIGFAFDQQLNLQPLLKAKIQAIFKKFFLRAGIVAAGAIGNTVVAYNYGFVASMITGVVTQSLLNHRTISKAGLKAGAIQGLVAYALFGTIWGMYQGVSTLRQGVSALGSALRSIELPEIPIVSTIVNAKIPIFGTDSHIGAGTAAILAINLFHTAKAIRARDTAKVISSMIGLPMTLWFCSQNNQPAPATINN